MQYHSTKLQHGCCCSTRESSLEQTWEIIKKRTEIPLQKTDLKAETCINLIGYTSLCKNIPPVSLQRPRRVIRRERSVIPNPVTLIWQTILLLNALKIFGSEQLQSNSFGWADRSQLYFFFFHYLSCCHWPLFAIRKGQNLNPVWWQPNKIWSL